MPTSKRDKKIQKIRSDAAYEKEKREQGEAVFEEARSMGLSLNFNNDCIKYRKIKREQKELYRRIYDTK